MAYTNYNGGNNYNGNNQQRKTSDSVNTTGFVIYNERAGKFLEFTYFGRAASINIGLIPVGNGDGKYVSRKNAQKITANPSYESLCELTDMAEDVLESIKTTGTFNTIAVEIPKKNIIVELNNGSSLKLPTGIYFVIYKNVDANHVSNTMDFFPFDGVKYLKDYDPHTGTSTVEIGKTGDFKKFIRGLRESANAFTMAQSHTVAETSKAVRNTEFQAIAALCAKMNVDLSTIIAPSQPQRTGYSRQNNNGGGYPRQYQNNNGNNQTPSNAYQAAFASANEPVDVNVNMNDLRNVDFSNFQ